MAPRSASKKRWVTVGISIEAEQREALRRLGEQNDRKLSAEIRQAIRLYLEHQEARA
jgi:hypothetical protein